MTIRHSNHGGLTRRSLAVAIGLALSGGAVHAGTIAVTTTDDAGPGSFREAIQTANSNLGTDTIDFSQVAGDTITLASDLPVITDDLTLQGSEVTLDGNGQSGCLAADASNLAVEDMTITNCIGGYLGGAGRGIYRDGGGILVANAALTVTGSTITNNMPTGQPRGGGAYGLGGGIAIFGGALVVSDSTISGNTAGDGGGIYAAGGPAAIIDSTLSGNSATGAGGGIMHFGLGFTRDDAPSGEPPPVALEISRSLVSGNSASQVGGGVMSFSKYAEISIDETEIVDNQVGDAGGGFFIQGGPSAMAVTNSTISGNSAVGGGAGGGLLINKYPGTVELSNNTISNNSADFIGGLYLSIDSGGQNPRGTIAPIQLVGQTISGNTATAGTGGGLTAAFPEPETVVIGNSIIAGNSAAVGADDLSATTPSGIELHGDWADRLAARLGRDRIVPPRGGPVPGSTTFDVSFSVIGQAPDDGSNFSPDAVTTSLLGEDPELGALADNGGPTRTHLPAATSPALNVVTGTGGCGTSFSLDQRGEDRPEPGGSLCDAGSVERGALPLIDVNPDIDFGTINVGDSAGPEVVTLANSGGSPLEVTAFNGLAAPFTLDFSDCAAGLPFSLAAGDSCNLQAGFAPGSAGAFAQTITVDSDSGPGGDDSFELSGTAVAPGISANPLAFGGVPVGQTVADTVTIENTGQGSLEISGLSLSDDGGGVFAIGGDTCGAPIAAGDSCQVTIDFTPSAAVAFSGSLAVGNNATAEPLEVALSGEGLIGNLVISPAGGLNFGDVPVGDSGQDDLTLENDGDAPIEVTGWSDPVAPFSIQGGTCPTPPFTLQPGESCTLTFGFEPTDAGDYGETLDFSVNDGSGGASVPVNVSGRGTAPGGAAIAVPTLDRIGLIIGGGLLALMGLLGLRRRQDGKRV